MAFRQHGPTTVFGPAAAFGASAALQTGSGMNIRVRNGSLGAAWVIVADNAVDANAALIPVAGTPRPGVFSLAPGESLIVNNPLGTSNQGAWVNACTPSDPSPTSYVEFAPGSGSEF